jgi:hypothetical protein
VKKSAPINFAPSENWLRAFKLLRPWLLAATIAAGLFAPSCSLADADVQLTGVPDYDWQYGCFGTASGNLMGYWDRHGFPDFYTGPTAGGVAPLRNISTNAGIRSLWASQAGFDGRPAGVFGHVDDYYSAYANTRTDRYVLSNRTEHVADSIGDFIGLSQKRWTNMNNECDGNIDGYSFAYWETNGAKRVNFVPPPQGTNAGRDIPSGLREWTQYRGYDAEVFSQLVSINPKCPSGQGFTFDDLRAEIDAGYPVLVFLQSYTQLYRVFSGMPKANPEIHGMLIYGYEVYEGYGTNVYCRDSWGGSEQHRNWSAISWVTGANLPIRGVIGYHPKPRMRFLSYDGMNVTVRWDGPGSQLFDALTGISTAVHRYQLERSLTLDPPDFQPAGPPTTDLTISLPECCADAAYYRVQLLPP